MRYPEFIRDGGTIGFVAPSFGSASEPYESAFKSALREFTRRGYKAVLGPNCFASDGIGISSSSKSCAKELTDFYTSTENDILISCGGGELMCGILPFVDFDAIGKAPAKWFMGYSDNTNFTFLLTTICDIASIYGPCAATFGMNPWHESITDAYQLLKGETTTVHGYELWEKEELKSPENPFAPYNVSEHRELRYFVDGELLPAASVKMSGRLLGGCMDCLVNLLGTTFDHVSEFNERYKEDGIIWFLEACDLNVMSIRRAIWQMEHAGWFQYTKGFLIGRPYFQGQEMMGLDQYHAVCDILAEYNVPIIMDVDLGHLPPMMPLICGSLAEVTSEDNKITIQMREEE